MAQAVFAAFLETARFRVELLIIVTHYCVP